jgi:hypothetical protein
MKKFEIASPLRRLALRAGVKTVLATAGLASFAAALQAAPLASNVVLSGTNVNFILNQPADTLGYRVNNGPLVLLDGSTKGAKSFSVGAPTDKFTIIAGKTESGYTTPTGGPAIAADANGLQAAAPAAVFNLISDDSSLLNRFQSPRGLSVSNNPNAPNFGTAYISNSAAGATVAPGIRNVGDGIYALRADGSDAFGYGDTAANPGGVFVASASTPWRNYVGPDGQLYVADFTDTNGNVYVMNQNLTTAAPTLNGIGGPSTVPATQKHGSANAVYVEGSLAEGNLKLYTIDEDLTELTGTGSGNNTTKLNLWRYDIGAGPLPYAGTPTKLNGPGTLLINGTDELIRGADGKFYLSQLRSAGTDAATVLVLDSNGSTVLFNSFTASGGVQDILRNAQGMSISEDQKWMALMLNNSDVAVVPMINGIPDLANRMVVDTGTNVNSGRDIAFDAAGNIHYASSGQQLYRVIAPGGTTWARTTYDNGQLAFSINDVPVPEPASATMLGLSALGLVAAARRRRAIA